MLISALQIFFVVVVVFFAKFRQIGQYQAVIILAAGSSNLLDRWLFSGVRDIFYLPILNLTNNLADWLIFLTIIFGILTKLKQEHQ
jgi:lipoprotein signal peptidase